jgi:organic hydroperoxide reductase OsmC/OhrA
MRLMLTFLYQMQRRKLEVLAYESSAQGTLEHSDGKHRVTRIVVQPRVSLRSEKDIAAAREAIKDTAELCMISNSILAAVQLDPRFEVSLASA